MAIRFRGTRQNDVPRDGTTTQAHEIRAIVELRLRGVVSRLRDKKLKLSLGESAMGFLAAAGYDPLMGARPVKRAVQKELETPLSLALLQSRCVRDRALSLPVQSFVVT